MQNSFEAKNSPSTATFTIEWCDDTVSWDIPGPRKRPDTGRDTAKASQPKRKKVEETAPANPVTVSKSFIIPKGSGYLYRRSLQPQAKPTHPPKVLAQTCQENVALPTKAKPEIEETCSIFRMRRKKTIGHAVNYQEIRNPRGSPKNEKSKNTEEVPKFQPVLTDSQLSVATFIVETDCGEEEIERGKSPEGSVKSWMSEYDNGEGCEESAQLAYNVLIGCLRMKPQEEEKQKKRRRRTTCLWACGTRHCSAVCKHAERSPGLCEETLIDAGAKSRRTLSEPSTFEGFVRRNENESGISANSSLAHMNCDDPEEFCLWKRVPTETNSWETALYRKKRSWSVLSLAAFTHNRLSDTPGGILQILRNGDNLYRRAHFDPSESDRFSSDLAVRDTFDAEPSVLQKNFDIRNWVDALRFHESWQEQEGDRNTYKETGVGAIRDVRDQETQKIRQAGEREIAALDFPAAQAPMFYFQIEQLLTRLKCHRQDVLQRLSNHGESQATLAMSDQAMPALSIFLLGMLLAVNFVVCELRDIVANLFHP